ncbi:MAG TPA: helix-turn-helix domain-containing protein, partial [Bacillota bacterium]
PFQVIIIEIIGGVTERNEEERLLTRIGSLNIIRQLLAEVDYVTVFMDTSQRLVIINNNEEIDLNTLAERLKTSLINRLRHSFCIGVGNWHQGESGIRSSYREACEALNYKVLIGKNEIIFYQDLHFYVSEEPYLSNEQVDMLGFYLKAGMGAQVGELLELIFKELAANQTISVDRIRVAGSNVIMKILNILTVLGIDTAGIFGKEGQPYEHVFVIDTLPEMKEYIFGISMKTSNLINQIYHKKANKLVQEIQDYLIKNYHDSELSLTKVAKIFYVNPSYLSRIFKQETNQTFVEYLTQIRMEKARKIFKETDLKAYQVAERVGITDPHYFGLCFKKYTGISVNDFKKSQL